MKQLKVPAEVYSRVVGYFRPVSQWNYGKQDEFGERTNLKFERSPLFDEKCSCSHNECQL